MNNFNRFITELTQAFNLPLPGQKAQFMMEPVTRKKELERQQNRTNPRLSGVMILLYPHQGEIKTVMIKRPQYPGVHSGQIAFPGGRKEDFDTDLIETALRENEEEIGIKRERVKLIGQLTTLYIPPSNYDVLPVVGYLNERPEFIPDQKEVDGILEINIVDFLKTKNIRHKKVLTRNNIQVSVICYFIQNEIIWGASAMIISELTELLKKTSLKF